MFWSSESCIVLAFAAITAVFCCYGFGKQLWGLVAVSTTFLVMNGVVLVGARSSLLHSCNEWLCILGVDDTSDSPVTKYTISLISVGFCVAISLVANCVVSSNPEKQM